MALDNPNHISGVLRTHLDSPLDKASFDVGRLFVNHQGPTLQTVAASPAEEIEAIARAPRDYFPLGVSKAAWLLGVTGAVMDRRADESYRELAERVAGESYGGSE